MYILLLQVVFSDESAISVLDDRVKTLKRWSWEEFKAHCLKKTVELLQKIMVWGVIPVHGTSRLHNVEGTRNAMKTLEVANDNFCLK